MIIRKITKTFQSFSSLLLVLIIICLQMSCQKKEFTSTIQKFNTIEIDSLLFATAAEYVKSNGLKYDDSLQLQTHLQIDPHLVDSVAKDFIELKNSNFYKSNSRQLKHRVTILEKLRINQTDAVKDQECVFSQGLPEPPDPDSIKDQKPPEYPIRCDRKGFFITVIFSMPEVAADTRCFNSNKYTNSQPVPCWKIRAFEYTTSSRFAYAIYITKNPNNGWKVIRKEKLWGEFS